MNIKKGLLVATLGVN